MYIYMYTYIYICTHIQIMKRMTEPAGMNRMLKCRGCSQGEAVRKYISRHFNIVYYIHENSVLIITLAN